MTNLAFILGNTTFTWDLGIIAFLFFAAFFYGLNAGARQVISFLLGIYFANLLIVNAPYLEGFLGRFDGFQAFGIEAGIFIGTVLVIFLLITGSALRSVLRAPKKDESRWWHLLLLATVATGLFAASLLAFLPESYYNNLSALTLELLIESNAIFWWSLAGIITFVILRKTKKKL